jgi:hypothetical protein
MADSDNTITQAPTANELDRISGELLLAVLAAREAQKRLAAAIQQRGRK